MQWGNVILEKLIITQMVKKFSGLYRAPRFITAFTRAWVPSLRHFIYKKIQAHGVIMFLCLSSVITVEPIDRFLLHLARILYHYRPPHLCTF